MKEIELRCQLKSDSVYLENYSMPGKLFIESVQELLDGGYCFIKNSPIGDFSKDLFNDVSAIVKDIEYKEYKIFLKLKILNNSTGEHFETLYNQNLIIVVPKLNKERTKVMYFCVDIR